MKTSMHYTPTTTLYWRALRRVERRSRAFRADPGPRNAVLLAQACRAANRLFHLAYRRDLAYAPGKGNSEGAA